MGHLKFCKLLWHIQFSKLCEFLMWTFCVNSGVAPNNMADYFSWFLIFLGWMACKMFIFVYFTSITFSVFGHLVTYLKFSKLLWHIQFSKLCESLMWTFCTDPGDYFKQFLQEFGSKFDQTWGNWLVFMSSEVLRRPMFLWELHRERTLFYLTWCDWCWEQNLATIYYIN